VQQETLETYARRFAEAQATQQAIGHLIDGLEQEKKTFKADFARRFTAFAARVDGKHRPWQQSA
jgi:hypothetical protein